MKGKGISFLIALTSAIVAAAAVIGGAVLLRTPRTQSEGSMLITVALSAFALLAIEMIVYSRNIDRYAAKSAALISRTEKESLLNFPAPAAIIDADGCIIWYNRLFAQHLCGGEEAYGLNVSERFKVDINKCFDTHGDLICCEGRFYNVIAVKTDAQSEMTMIYFADRTDFVELDYKYRMTRQSVIIVMIDNYEELIADARESEKAHLLVSLESLIENFVEGTNGFSRRMGSDRFYVIMEERSLRPIIDKRFGILEQARLIKVGERANVTLSIGVGCDAESLAESERYAKQALEMCLGRGGDQAAVRTQNGYDFYGGLSRGVSKNTRVKSRMIAGALSELIGSYDRTLVMGHSYGDLDSVGSATAICAAAMAMGKDSYVVVDPEKNLSKLMIRYIEENTIRNYYITPDEGFEKLTDDTLLIICDTHNPDLVDSKEIFACAKHIAVIDHHRLMVKSIEGSELFYHEPSASSACEMTAELLEYFPVEVKLPSQIADALLAGIMLDTKNFVMNTGVRTFEAAAYLRRLGADTVMVKKMFSNPIETYQNKALIVGTSDVYRKCAIAEADGNFENIRVAASKAADEMLEITGVNASFVLYELCGKINISARSLGRYNVQVIMESLGGGGHHQMAACQLDADMKDARKRLIEAIDEYIRNN